MNEQEQFEEWFANDTKGLDKASARAGWVERMANESAEIARLREERDAYKAQFEAAQKQEPVAVCDESDDGLFVDLIYGEDGNPLKLGDKLYAAPVPAQALMPDLLPALQRTTADARALVGYLENITDEVARLNGLEGGAKS